MNNRRIFTGLVVVALIAILGIMWWLFGAAFMRSRVPAEQPPALPADTQAVIPQPNIPLVAQPVIPPTAAEQQEFQKQDIAIQRAKFFAATLGTYSSVEGFSSFRDVRVQATPEIQDFLMAEQKRLTEAHPAYGPSWSQSTRALSAKISSALPMGSADTVEVQVDTQQVVESAQAPQQISYQRATVAMRKVGSTWFVSRITWSAFEL